MLAIRKRLRAGSVDSGLAGPIEFAGAAGGASVLAQPLLQQLELAEGAVEVGLESCMPELQSL